jgi:putative ABC transport system ATP-binding protein
MSSNPTAIRAHGVYKRFKTGRTHIEVLKRVDFDANHGEVTMVMGPSGSGKSTLVAALSGLLRPDEGTVGALNQDIWSLRSGKLDRFRLDHCGFIFQGFNLFASLTALQQVTQVLKYTGLSGSAAREKAETSLAEVGLEKRMNSRPSEMSGGEKQRVAIARALANRPAVLLADEPTGELDAATGREILELFRRLNDEGTTLIVVTHDDRLAAEAGRAIHMLDGTIRD